MEAVILAGGFGTRLKEVVPDLPKPMAPIAGRPFLEILLCSLSAKGVQRAVLALGYMSEKIINYFGKEFSGIELIYEVEKTPLGTGGALRQALTRCYDDHVFVFNGDTFLDLEITAVEQHWKLNHIPIIVAREVPDTARYGRLIVTSDNKQVSGFVEKGITGAGLINGGCYVLPRNIFTACEFPIADPFSFETDFLVKAVAINPYDLFVTQGHFIDIGIPEDFVRAQKELAQICR